MGDKPLFIDLKNVKKRFPQGGGFLEALKGINFNVEEGELHMIVGPSGCGKTTLLSIIAGTLKPNEGSVEVSNTFLEKLSDDDLTLFRRKNIGFIFQQYNLIPTLTLAENVCIPLLLNGTLWDEALEEAKKILKKVGLEGREHDFPSKLSGGQQQRVAIARALIHEPKLVICDEPTAALDAETGQNIMNLMREIVKEKDRVVLVVTHDNRIFSFADRLSHMDDGLITHTEKGDQYGL